MSNSMSRLDVFQLVSRVQPDSPTRAWLFRCLAGSVAGIATFVIFSHLNAWARLLALPTTILVIWRSNGARLHDLFSELCSRLSLGRSVTLRPGQEPRSVPVRQVRAGDWVCPESEFKAAMRDYERRLELAADASAYRIRALQQVTRGTAGPPDDYVNGSAFLQRSRQHQHRSVPAPVIRYREVIAICPENDRYLRVGLAGDRIVVWASEKRVLIHDYYSAVCGRGVDSAGQALNDLVIYLRAGSSAITQRQLVDHLCSSQHARPEIRRALRAAVACHLIRRPLHVGRYLGEVGRAIAGGPDVRWHGDDCELILTRLGRLWLEAEAVDPDDVTQSDQDKRTFNHANMCTYIIGDNNRVIQKADTSVEVDLSALRQLLEAFKTQQSTASDEVREALRMVETAVSRGEPRAPASCEAVRTILNLTGQVLLGVLGNVVFEQLRNLAG